MKYFRKDFISGFQIEQLKKVLRESAKIKTIEYNGNFIERVEMEKAVRIRNKDSEIYDLISEYLEPWTKVTDDEIVWRSIEEGKYYGYDFNSLPSKLKRVLRQYDQILYEIDLQKLMNPPEIDYDKRVERLKQLIPDYTDMEFENYVVLGHPFPSPLGKKARESARRSYRVMNEIIKSNIDKFTQFVTLTFAPIENKERHRELNDNRQHGECYLEFEYIDGKDFERAKEVYTDCIKSIQERYKRKGKKFEYVTVWELQRNGNYHFHLLCSELDLDEKYRVPDWLDTNMTTGKKNNGHGLTAWKYGKSDVQEIKDPARVTTYVSKYIIKSFLNVTEDSYMEYLNKKKYYCSRGLVRPVVTYDTEFELSNDGYEETLTREYVNAYNEGNIKKTYYTKIV